MFGLPAGRLLDLEVNVVRAQFSPRHPAHQVLSLVTFNTSSQTVNVELERSHISLSIAAQVMG
jgi:hypothetical protein